MSGMTVAGALDITRDATPTVVGEARELLNLRLGAWGLDRHGGGELAADARVILCELVTNAVRATPEQRIRVVVVWEAPKALRFSVWDGSDTPPRLTPTGELTLDELDLLDETALTSGRGLPLVEALCKGDCGYTRTPPHGKWVSARLTL